MTDRIHSFVVVLDRDLRTDDAEATLNALRQIKGVIAVQPQIADVGTMMAYARARTDLGSKLIQVLRDE